jgi:DNA repair protein RadC
MNDVFLSEADITLTERLKNLTGFCMVGNLCSSTIKNAGQLLGINVLNHVMFEKDDRFYSFEN